jgi:ABC-type multidrug transport system fused ATPase/permease subunit
MLRAYLKFFQFVKTYKLQVVLFLVLLLIASLAENIQPYFYKIFIEAIQSANHSSLLHILIVFILIRFADNIFNLFKQWVGDWIVFRVSRDVRIGVFKKIQELDFAFHQSHSTGSLISAIKRGDGAIFDLQHNITSLLQIFLGFVVMFIFFFGINWTIALLILLSLVFNLVATIFLVKVNVKSRAAFNHAEDEISDIITDNLINYETVKLFAKENYESDRLSHSYQNWMTRLWAYGNSFRLMDIVIGTISNVSLFFILLIGLDRLVNLKLDAGQYIMILGFVSAFYPRFFELIWNFRNLAKNYVDLQRYFSILDQSVLVKDPITPKALNSVKGEIEFKNVSFTYPEGKKGAVSEINLHVSPGQSIAFVGRSGVGKTTLVKLLMRFFDPTSGQITVDGINIKKFTKHQLRSFMGVVPQEPILFNNTIAYNIGYGIENATLEDIIGAAKMANLHGFIDGLPLKYETHVGERGVKLSGGQKQRLAIARMILSQPDIVIFDEATSQLDSESEKLIQEAFWKAVKNRTTFIIAHRLSTITRAEKIVVMEHGKIKEIGSHRQLIADESSLYSKFWQLQTHSEN